MPQVAAVKFRFNPKHFWFDPQGATYNSGDHVLVETERGREVGLVADGAFEVTNTQLKKLKSPLRPILRLLTDLDYDHIDALDAKGREAMPFYRELIDKYKLNVKPVEVQFLFSGDRAVFFFSSEERVDFRELVRELSSHFHVRIDMRQIGARDEARELGGLAHCGEELCCCRFGGDFQPVSIRMAKEQDLPLNQTKISGVCGRLMCCLRYEFEAYKDFNKRALKRGTIVNTPLGKATITGSNTPRESMELRLEDGKRINVPLAEIECQKNGENCTTCSVSHETIERCAAPSILLALSSLQQQLESSSDKDLLTHATQADEPVPSRHPRRRRDRTADNRSLADNEPARHTNRQADKTETAKINRKGKLIPTTTGPGAKHAASVGASRPRPGQHSSGLRKRRSHPAKSASAPPSISTSARGNDGSSTGGNSDSRAKSERKVRQRSARHSGGGQQAIHHDQRPDEQGQASKSTQGNEGRHSVSTRSVPTEQSRKHTSRPDDNVIRLNSVPARRRRRRSADGPADSPVKPADSTSNNLNTPGNQSAPKGPGGSEQSGQSPQ
ncbi:MAG: hypothetical protein LBC35_00925 [Coriobacteriales bacterium]|jgi:cell fate regulator YaaT (PSP1 superfamily)|nr:hypothetical protein [Coriobacteriales bacterium]